MFLEKYFVMLAEDLTKCEDALESTLPDAVRTGLEAEQRRLRQLYSVLSGDQDVSILHSSRARLRWSRERLKQAKDPHQRKAIEQEIAGIEEEIQREVERREKGETTAMHRYVKLKR